MSSCFSMNKMLSLLTLACLLTIPAAACAQEVLVSPDNLGNFAITLITPSGTQTLHTTPHNVVNAAVQTVPNSPALGVTWTEVHRTGLRHFFAVSRDGKKFHGPKATSYELRLRYAAFDPMASQPQIPSHLDANQGGQIWIVQYWTQGLEEYRHDLRTLGAKILLHMPQHANVVEMSPALVATVAELPYVRTVTSYHPAYKLDEALLQEQVQGFSAIGARRVNVMTFRRGLAGQNPVASRILALGGKIDQLDSQTYRLQATLDLRLIAEIALMDEVQWIDPAGDPENDMSIARQFHGADYVETQGGFDGTGVRGEVLDSGCLTTHQEFQSPPLIPHGSLVNGSHGTSTTGEVFSTGVDAGARGMLPAGQGVAAFYNGYAGGSRYNHTAELVNPSLNYRCVFQTNSWGNPRTTQYTSDSQEMDLMLFDFQNLVICQSQSNAGNQMSRPQAWAKNCVGVGAADHVNTVSATDDNVSGASIGPAADGRVKPELASFYDNIRTTSNSSNSAYTNTFGGTSGATPITAGAFGLFFQMWHAGIFGNATSTTVFDSAPKNTTARAFVIASARQWDWLTVPANSGLDRDRQGWGHPDLQRMYAYRNKTYFVNETDVLSNLGSTIHPVVVSPGESLFKATLVWRDNPGTVSSTQHLINDMDLKVTSPSGIIYRGNNGLTNGVSGSSGEALRSSPGGSSDTDNSAENVFVDNPQAGTWLVEVIASDINQDNHVETGALDADYALCVIGVQPGSSTFFDLGLSKNASNDVTITLSNVPAGTIRGYTVFAENQTGSLGGGPLFGLNPTYLSLFSFMTPPQPGSPFAWTWPVSGLYPDVPLVAPSVPGALFPIDGIGIAFDGGFNLSTTPIRRLN